MLLFGTLCQCQTVTPTCSFQIYLPAPQNRGRSVVVDSGIGIVKSKN